jgi:hypothetical protein
MHKSRPDKVRSTATLEPSQAWAIFTGVAERLLHLSVRHFVLVDVRLVRLGIIAWTAATPARLERQVVILRIVVHPIHREMGGCRAERSSRDHVRQPVLVVLQSLVTGEAADASASCRR